MIDKLTKAAALRLARSEGYTVEYLSPGQCGDRAFGSRIYLKRPTARLNEYGMPVGDHCTVDNLGPRYGWRIARF